MAQCTSVQSHPKQSKHHSSPSVPILLCLLLFLLLFLSLSLSLSSTHLLCTCCQHVIFPKSQRLMPDTRAAGICTLTELCKWRYEQPVMPHCKNFLLPSIIWDTVLYLWAGCLVLFAWVHFCWKCKQMTFKVYQYIVALCSYILFTVFQILPCQKASCFPFSFSFSFFLSHKRFSYCSSTF